jgi:uncharacterized protein (TIGR00255 family)
MTGYGEVSMHADGVHYFLELRSLNNKYFKGVIRLPEEFQGLEAELESKLRERLTRGTITLSASCSSTAESAAHDINEKALSRYVEALRRLPMVAAGELKLDLGALLSLPGVLQPPGDEEARLGQARTAFGTLLNQAIDALLRMREREGRALLADLESQQAFIAERLTLITGRAPEVISEYQRRLKARIDQLLAEAGATVQPVDLIREIASYAERVDIAEEIKRLTGHLEQFASLISDSQDRPVGRTLDFLAQEMLREANTMASKSPDASISRWTVEIKGAIDRIKEQAANVE